MPTKIITRAIKIVATRSIFSRFSSYFFNLAIFSVMIIRTPEIASIKLCRASEIIAIEFEIIPTSILKIDKNTLMAMKR